MTSSPRLHCLDSEDCRYACELHRSIDNVDANEWQHVVATAENLYLEPRFLKAVELSFAREAEFWYAIYRDPSGQAVAVACFSRFRVDGALLASSAWQKAVQSVRRLWDGFLRFHVLLCGLPVSTCDSSLAIAPGADVETLLASLDDTATTLARQTGCWLISFKEFPPELARHVDGLRDRGFLRARSCYPYHLKGSLSSFDAYLSGRSSDRRGKIRKSLKRLEESGLSCEELSGREGAEKLLSPEVHQLYLNVLNRAELRFECLPLEFFQELARQMPDESRFAFYRSGERIVAFSCGVTNGRQYAMLFCGLDYAFNTRQSDLYFNIIYRGLIQGLEPGLKTVHLGAAADEFKQNMGAQGHWLTVYVKAADAFKHLLLKRFFWLLFDTRDATNAPPPAGTLRESSPTTTPPKPSPAPQRRAA